MPVKQRKQFGQNGSLILGCISNANQQFWMLVQAQGYNKGIAYLAKPTKNVEGNTHFFDGVNCRHILLWLYFLVAH